LKVIFNNKAVLSRKGHNTAQALGHRSAVVQALDPKLTINIVEVAVVDPIESLAHDHRELNGLLVAVHEALVRVERGQSQLDDEIHEIRDGIEVFREALLEHFAREQEGILPFVLTLLPESSERVDRLIAEHDRIAEFVTKIVDEVGRSDTADASARFRAALTRFDELYAAHAKTELAFFKDVTTALSGDRDATERLRALLDEP
jgi:hemerythrin-like domain-containing protein